MIGFEHQTSGIPRYANCNTKPCSEGKGSVGKGFEDEKLSLYLGSHTFSIWAD
jgi:hypothetical protein